jgi:hypothetical protein
MTGAATGPLRAVVPAKQNSDLIMSRPGDAHRKRIRRYDAHPTSTSTSASRSGMSTMMSWPHGISKVRQVGSALQTAR